MTIAQGWTALRPNSSRQVSNSSRWSACSIKPRQWRSRGRDSTTLPPPDWPELRLKESRRQWIPSRSLRQLDGRRRDIITEGIEAGHRPGAHVMARPATRDTDSPALQFRMGVQKIDQARRRLALFPRHVFGLVAIFPIFSIQRRHGFRRMAFGDVGRTGGLENARGRSSRAANRRQVALPHVLPRRKFDTGIQLFTTQFLAGNVFRLEAQDK